MIFDYTLNISYTFKFKSAFGNQKCALFLFSAPRSFLSVRETLQLWGVNYINEVENLWQAETCFVAKSFFVLYN